MSRGSVTRPAELETQRLILRTWLPEDRVLFAALNADPAVMEQFPRTMTPEQSDTLADRIAREFAVDGWGLWAVEVKGGARFIGFVGLHPVPLRVHFAPAVEIGWRLAQEHWGFGYATEAAREAMAFGFDNILLPEIVSFTSTTNVRSERVMQRIGMHHDPRDDFQHPRIPQGHPLGRQVLYRLDRPSWLTSVGRIRPESPERGV
ncbi:MAG: GNAT family N-acetyltransferase [Candidatus Dormibacteria bacterium]